MTKDKMIYNDDNTIGVDEQSLNKLMNILTPRMKDQLFDELHNNSPDGQPNWFKDGNLNKYYEVNQ